jgi:hypothetical protein
MKMYVCNSPVFVDYEGCLASLPGFSHPCLAPCSASQAEQQRRQQQQQHMGMGGPYGGPMHGGYGGMPPMMVDLPVLEAKVKELKDLKTSLPVGAGLRLVMRCGLASSTRVSSWMCCELVTKLPHVAAA